MLGTAGEKLRDPELAPVHQRATDALVRAGEVKREATKRRDQEQIRQRNERVGLMRW